MNNTLIFLKLKIMKKLNKNVKKSFMFLLLWIWKHIIILNYLNPKEKLSIFIRQTNGEETVLTATQTGDKKEFSFKQLLINFFKYPLMTIKIISSIHYEAFFLWKKGAVYRKRDNKILNNLSYEEY